MNTNNYYKYLKSPEWKVKTLQINAIYNHKCALCQSKDKLNVHHITYRHLYYEPLADLILLCKPCHTLLHNLVDLYLENMDMLNVTTNNWYTNRFRHKVAELMCNSLIDSNFSKRICIYEYKSVKEYWEMISGLVIIALNEHMVKHHIDIKLTSLPEVTAELFNMLTDYHQMSLLHSTDLNNNID